MSDAEDRLRAAGIENARQEARWLVTDEEIERRCRREPLQYILGTLPFGELELIVHPGVLIPRPETEELLYRIKRELSKRPLQGKCLFDLCCGSGCLAIGLKRFFPELRVIASDISHDAVQLTRENAQKNSVEIEVLQGDLLAPFQGVKADFVVSNPPYIAASDYPHLQEEVVKWEPFEALVGGEDGLAFYRRFHQELPPFLNEGAQVFFEIGMGQGEAVRNLFQGGEIGYDLAGKERFFFM